MAEAVISYFVGVALGLTVGLIFGWRSGRDDLRIKLRKAEDTTHDQ